MSKNFYLLLLYFLCAFLVTSHPSFAQNSFQTTDEDFGRNRIQYKEFKWRYLSAENFDVYFYQGGEKIAKEVAEYLEDEFDRITDLIGYPPYSKTRLFLYNSVSDLQQSNVGVDQTGISIGGETQFIKPYIEIAHPGSISALKEELLNKVSSLMINEMMFGGNLSDMFQSAVLLNLPEWFISGASLYVAEGWSMEMDDFVRDLMKGKNPQNLNKLTGREAALAGQSLWNFIAQKYGKSNISNILNYTRIIRNEQRSINITLGVSFDQLMYEWQNYYTNIDQLVAEAYQPLKEEKKIPDSKNRRKKVYRHVSLNNKGDLLAYTENNQGRYSVHVKNLETGKDIEVIKGGYKVINQEIDPNMPLVDWVDSATIGVIHGKGGRLIFELYDMNTKSSLPRFLRKFEQVQSLDFSDNGRLAIVSGVVNGRNDLYLLSTRRDRTRRIMNDIFDDRDASFMPNSNTIVFSSNRTTDTLDLDNKEFDPVTNNYNLFFYSLDTTKNVVHRITNTISTDTKPLGQNSNIIFYLSDQKGIRNIFKYDIDSRIYTQISNYSSSIVDYDINFESQGLALSSEERSADYIYYEPGFDLSNQIFTPQTPRKQLLQAKAFVQRKQQSAEQPQTIQEIVEARLREQQEERELENLDTIQFSRDSLINAEDGFINTDDYNFDMPTEEADTVIVEDEEEIIDTDDYTFETDALEESQKPSDSFLAQYRKLRQAKDIKGPYGYQPRFSAKNLTTSFRIDPFRGFSALLQTEMYDMLENHKFTGGVLIPVFDLKSGDVYASYEYLKERLDFSANFERNVLFYELYDETVGTQFQKYSKNTLELGVALPINTKLRFAIKPFYTFTQLDNTTSAANIQTENITEHYAGATAELVYDNSIINGMNIIEGNRGKIEFTHYESTTDKDRSFSRVKVDLRHYQPIHKEIVLAGRLYYGSFFGRSPKKFLLGGMDNWLFNEENKEGINNPLAMEAGVNNSDILFTEFATNLRGFDYGEMYGENVLLFNAELRIPIIRYLTQGPIASNFFRNLQFTGFFDIGSAWTGFSPFNEDNQITQEVLEESNFTIRLERFTNPWLYSYGAGLRTMILGFYVKLDVAWPVINYSTESPQFVVTFGYDF